MNLTHTWLACRYRWQCALFLFLLLSSSFLHSIQAQNCAIEFVAEFTNINGPLGVATDKDGNVYVAETNSSRILKFSSTGTLLMTLGNPGTNNGEFAAPFGVAIDNNGNILVVDGGNNRIQKFTSTGTHLFTVGAAGGLPGAGNGEFDNPAFITTDAAGNIYVGDVNNNRIQKFSSTGMYLLQWTLNTPFGGLAVDSSGNILAVDQATQRVLKFTNTGTLLMSFGGPGTGNGQLGGPPFGPGPLGLAVDNNDNIYVVDPDNLRVQKFTNNGTYLTQFGTPGNGNGQFSFPVGIAVDLAGNIYVSDVFDSRVQKFRQVCPSNVSAQRAGSVLVFPYYISKAATKADTRMTISNISSAASTVANQAYVHLFFVDGTTCAQADLFLCLTPNASFSFKASEYDPEATGWLLAVAVNQAGTPIQNNTLIGNAFVTDGNYVDNYGAEGFWANFAEVATLNANGTATLRFDGSGYERVPSEFAAEIQSPVDVAGQRIVTAGLNGDLTTGQVTGAAQAGTALVYNGNEKPFGSFSAFLNGNCQALATITTSSPRVPNGMAVMIPSGQTGWMRVKVGGAVGLIMTPRTATWKGIRALHKISYTSATLTISTFRPVC